MLCGVGIRLSYFVCASAVDSGGVHGMSGLMYASRNGEEGRGGELERVAQVAWCL